MSPEDDDDDDEEVVVVDDDDEEEEVAELEVESVFFLSSLEASFFRAPSDFLDGSPPLGFRA